MDFHRFLLVVRTTTLPGTVSVCDWLWPWEVLHFRKDSLAFYNRVYIPKFADFFHFFESCAPTWNLAWGSRAKFHPHCGNVFPLRGENPIIARNNFNISVRAARTMPVIIVSKLLLILFYKALRPLDNDEL